MPSAKVKEVPEPAVQVEPLSVLYSQVAPASRPEIFSCPSLVMLSELLEPVSEFKAKVRELGAVVSTVMALALEPTVEVLPATSLWRT